MSAELMLATSRTTRRAWVVLLLAFVTFSVLLSGTGLAAYRYAQGATREREGRLEASGDVLLQPRNETRFKQVRAGELVREGDAIKTPRDVPARLVLADNVELRLAEESLLSVDEMSVSRFLGDQIRTRLTQQQGWARLVAVPARQTAVAFYEVRIGGMTVEAEVRPGQSLEMVFESRAMEWLADAPDQNVPLEATAVVMRGLATVRAGAETVQLLAGQKTSLARGGRLASPSLAARELIRNGAFQDVYARDGGIIWPRSWRETRDQGGDGGVLWGSTTLTHRDLEGQAAPMIVFQRHLNAKDNAVHGIQQPLNLPLSHFQALRLRVQLQVNDHSLSGGGFADVEYPIIIKVTYRDRQNRSIAWYRGFYTHNEEQRPVPNGIKVESNEWFTFQQDLLHLNAKRGDPEPVYLETLDIYAAGHDFEAAVVNVSIEGT